jgi:hypothetical protein
MNKFWMTKVGVVDFLVIYIVGLETWGICSQMLEVKANES